jgi:hypothetical protein
MAAVEPEPPALTLATPPATANRYRRRLAEALEKTATRLKQ